MSIVTYNLTAWEQGTINTSGDSSSSTRIRTVGYLEITPNTTVEYKVTAVDTNGNPLRWNPMLYNASKQCIRDGGWQNSGTTWSNTDKAKYVRFCLSYSSGDISPSNLGSCVFEYNDMMNWYVIDGELTNTNFIDGVQYSITTPYPKELWRISYGILYHELLPIRPSPPAAPVNQREYICAFDYHTLKTEFNGHGLGVLRPTSCLITEELNGNYELTIEHPIDSEGRWEWIQENNLIKALGQIFTIKTVQISYKGSVGKVKAKAVHVFYQLNDWWIRRGAHLVGQSVNALMASAAAFTEKHPEIGDTSYTFGFSSDVPVPNWTIGYEKWKDLENGMTPNEFLLGNDGVIANCGGELYRDNFRFSINQVKENSKENAFEIRVGKNLKGIERVIDLTTMVTYFQGYDNWGNWFAISWNADMTHFNIPHHVIRGKTYRYEFDDTYFATIPYEEQAAQLLETDVTREFKANCSPVISYTIDIEEVRDNPDYAELDGFSEYKVGNTGYIVDERLKERIGLKITRTVTDAITGNVKTVIFGDRRSLVSHPNYNTAITDLEPLPIAISFQILDSSGALAFDAEGAAIIQEEEVS